jgi:hypothetical protein
MLARRRSYRTTLETCWKPASGQYAKFIDAMHGKNVLCQIDANGYDSHDFPSQVS